MLFKKNINKKPTVLVTCSDKNHFFQVFFIKLAVRLAGGRAFCVSSKSKKTPKNFSGLILSGGTDIYPERYGKEPKLNYEYQKDRDSLEFKYLEKAHKNNLPVLGICRGAQLINIFHGGDLHIDITKAFEKSLYPSNLLGFIFFRKRINIIENCLLNKILRKSKSKVNSLHRQSIDKVGETLEATSFEENRIIQSVENKNKIFYLGVQFHPEFLIYKKEFRRIFSFFIDAAINGVSINGHERNISKKNNKPGR